MDDTLAAIGGGIVGTVVMLVIFYGAEMTTGYSFQAPEVMATMINAPAVLGLALFVGAGAILWPLLFAVFGWRLPGSSQVASGVVVALILWVAFTVGFSQGLARGDVALFVVVGLVAHLAYGVILGGAYQELGEGAQTPA
jgi:hypothetical protein